MNNTIKLAVASALLAAASTASAAGGIVAGDWTLDIGGIVNAYYTSTKTTGVAGGLAAANNTTTKTASNITTGLLPNYLIVSGKTRQNDLDVGFTISIQPGSSTTEAGGLGSLNQRQAFLTFGDASWGSIKLGKDLGIYASDAILNDMTLLGVGSHAGAAGGNTTLGRIGSGYIYADWKSQIAYTSPNFNGFSFTAGVTQAWNDVSTTVDARGGKEPAFEAKAAYAFAGDVSGKVWASGISQNMETYDKTSTGWDLGANVNMAGFGLTGYYGEGKGMGSATQFGAGGGYAGYVASTSEKLDSKDWYVQGTYTLPGVGTKLGVSYGDSKIDHAAGDGTNSNSMWTGGVYHPLTKHLNLVAEYSDVQNKSTGTTETQGHAKTMSLGAILFF